MSGVTIIGTGHYVPGKPVTNDAIARVIDTSDEWIQTRTGIKQRYFARDGQGASDLALGFGADHIPVGPGHETGVHLGAHE